MLQSPRRRSTLVLALAASTSLMSACIVVPAGRRYEEEAIAVAPPAPQVEVVGVAPGPGYFWIGGYWGWVGGRHVWVGGRWESHRPGWRWAPHGWYRHGPGWRAAPGRWERN
jgi:WXXGXW repeat (2 copies)